MRGLFAGWLVGQGAVGSGSNATAQVADMSPVTQYRTRAGWEAM